MPRRLLPVLLIVLAACSSGGSGGDAAHAVRRATGKPLVFGLINQENGPVGSFPELRSGAEAAVRYVNDERGGIDNRPIQLEVCVTAGTPESSEACANQLLAKRPVAVLGGVDLAAGAAVGVLAAAKIPYIGVTPSLGDELTSQSAFMLTGGVVADLLAETEYITGQLKATKVGVVHLDVSGGLTDAAILAARAILQQRGVTDLKVVPEKADAADFTAAVRTATASNPDVLLAIFPAQGCQRVLAAAKALRVRARIFLPSPCATQAVFDAIGTADVTFGSSFVPWTEAGDPDVAVYRSKVSEPSVLSQAGFALVMDVHRLLAGLDGDKVTAASVTKAVDGARGKAGFLGHEYTCDGQTITILPAICNAWVRLLTYRDGGLQDVGGGWVTGAPLVKLLTG